ncbi:MAG TPA: KGG domain-containing protein [Mucilaginibacter sp.]|nr:KGG domain-containing protein [Mucilaginibacter sp.]
MPTSKENQQEKQGHGGHGHSRGGSQSHGNTSQRGFASMNEEKQREIASKGGKAAHESGHAHEFSSEEAREAGRKGGEAVSRDKEHMAEIGRKGGEH